jgi:UDP-glucose 4-epimerase
MKILVTGGAGFIGSHFVDRFISEGHQVWALDNMSSGSIANLNRKAGLVVCDLKDSSLDGEIAKISPEAVFHLAAQADTQRSCTDPVFDACENITASLMLIEAGIKNGMRFFGFASSGGAIYGEAVGGPQSETHPEAPVNHNGVAKLAVDKYLYAYSIQRGLRSASLRFSNVYGPRQGVIHKAGVVANFAKLLSQGNPPLINGDGLQTRDFVYVTDLAEAASMILKQDATGVFNLGTGIETTILDLAKNLCGIAGVDASRIQHGPAIHGEQRRSVIDPSKAAKVLVWSPRTSFTNGLKTTYEWYIANKRVDE